MDPAELVQINFLQQCRMRGSSSSCCVFTTPCRFCNLKTTDLVLMRTDLYIMQIAGKGRV
eukprot:c8400_g1_i1 orf=358-537(+)